MAGGVVVRDGGLGISRAERAGGIPVGGGEFRFNRAGVMETRLRMASMYHGIESSQVRRT